MRSRLIVARDADIWSRTRNKKKAGITAPALSPAMSRMRLPIPETLGKERNRRAPTARPFKTKPRQAAAQRLSSTALPSINRARIRRRLKRFSVL
jgi:hypothetical protein